MKLQNGMAEESTKLLLAFDNTMQEIFRKFSAKISSIVGTPYAFLIAFLVVLTWFITGPTFHYSDTWQLVINTSTTIVTFLMVFLIQNTQNRDTRATQLKLDELIKSMKGARNSMMNIEQLSDEELDQLQIEFMEWRDKYVARLEKIQKIKASKHKG